LNNDLIDRSIDLFGSTELIVLDILAKTEKKRRGTEKTQRLSSQVPHKIAWDWCFLGEGCVDR